MPSDDSLRLEDFDRVQHHQVMEPRKHQAIDIADSNPLGRPTPQHIELMAKGENFPLQGCARSEQPGHGVLDQLEEIARPVIIDQLAGDRQLFWVHVRYRAALIASEGLALLIPGT
jgi:hypothetical protein